MSGYCKCGHHHDRHQKAQVFVIASKEEPRSVKFCEALTSKSQGDVLEVFKCYCDNFEPEYISEYQPSLGE